MKIIDNLHEFIEQIDNAKKTNPLDLSRDQDLSIAIMNLISIEEHLIFSGAKTQDFSFYDMTEEIREQRKQLLSKIIKTYKGEVWCISKHLLAACMRLMEVGTKLLHEEKKEEAYDFFNKSYDLYCLFWALNLNSITEVETKNMIEELNENLKEKDKIKFTEKEEKLNISNIENSCKKDKKGFLENFKELIKKGIDCCRE